MGVISIFGDRDSFWQSGQILYRVLEAFVLTEHRDRKTGQEDGTGGRDRRTWWHRQVFDIGLGLRIK